MSLDPSSFESSCPRFEQLWRSLACNCARCGVASAGRAATWADHRRGQSTRYQCCHRSEEGEGFVTQRKLGIRSGKYYFVVWFWIEVDALGHHEGHVAGGHRADRLDEGLPAVPALLPPAVRPSDDDCVGLHAPQSDGLDAVLRIQLLVASNIPPQWLSQLTLSWGPRQSAGLPGHHRSPSPSRRSCTCAAWPSHPRLC